MSAKAKAQLAGQTVGVISGSSGIGLETALPFCLYSPKCLERLSDKSGLAPNWWPRPAKTEQRSRVWPCWAPETQDRDALRRFIRQSRKVNSSKSPGCLLMEVRGSNLIAPHLMDAVAGVCETSEVSVPPWEVPYARIHLQNARGRGRDTGALRRGVGRAGPRLREPESPHAPGRNPRPVDRTRGRPARRLPAGRQRLESHLPEVV